jgi:hypothetical protein
VGASNIRVCATWPTVVTSEACLSLLEHHSSDRTTAVNHLLVAIELGTVGIDAYYSSDIIHSTNLLCMIECTITT